MRHGILQLSEFKVGSSWMVSLFKSAFSQDGRGKLISLGIWIHNIFCFGLTPWRLETFFQGGLSFWKWCVPDSLPSRGTQLTHERLLGNNNGYPTSSENWCPDRRLYWKGQNPQWRNWWQKFHLELINYTFVYKSGLFWSNQTTSNMMLIPKW